MSKDWFVLQWSNLSEKKKSQWICHLPKCFSWTNQKRDISSYKLWELSFTPETGKFNSGPCLQDAEGADCHWVVVLCLLIKAIGKPTRNYWKSKGWVTHDVVFQTFPATWRGLTASNCVNMAGIHKSNSQDWILAQGQDGCPGLTLYSLLYRLCCDSSVSTPSALRHFQANDISNWKIKVLAIDCKLLFIGQ